MNYTLHCIQSLSNSEPPYRREVDKITSSTRNITQRTTQQLLLGYIIPIFGSVRIIILYYIMSIVLLFVPTRQHAHVECKKKKKNSRHRLFLEKIKRRRRSGIVLNTGKRDSDMWWKTKKKTNCASRCTNINTEKEQQQYTCTQCTVHTNTHRTRTREKKGKKRRQERDPAITHRLTNYVAYEVVVVDAEQPASFRY